MPKTQVGDINLYYEIHGEGEPLLLIQGLAGRGEGFRSQLPAFAPHFKTIIFDNRGVGESDQPLMPWSMTQMAADAAGLLEALKIPQAHVFGVSMGGMIAQELALRHPQRITKLALGCTHSGIKHCTPSPPWVTDIFRNAKGWTREQFVRASIPINFAPHTRETAPDLIEDVVLRMISNKQLPHAFALQVAAIYNFDTYDRLPQIQQPTLVLTGKEDVLIPPDNSRVLTLRIPGAKLVEYDEAGHLFFIEKAEPVNQRLVEFFGS